ncbi:MAG: hypothetical protein HY610_04755 [Elusimicrobia bacterium]|nr:hypothetical protein [Elusimicrobiota bacterium]
MTSSQPPVPWYFSRVFVLIALASVGPLALPFLWPSPVFSKILKIVLTFFVLVATALFVWTLPALFQSVRTHLEIVRQAFPELQSYVPQ